MKKNRLTILVGAGAAIDLSNDLGESVSTDSITNDVLNKIEENKSILKEYKCKTCQLLNKIYHDRKDCSKYNDYKPNFEDLFHALDILNSLKVYKNSYPEYISMINTFVDIKQDYRQYLHDNDLTISFAISQVLNTILKSVEKYNKYPKQWFEIFFKELASQYYLDIFNLNYDTLFEQLYKENYNDGFTEETQKEDIECYAFNYSKYAKKRETNMINHLHGQIDFRYFMSEITNEFHEIYKLKNGNEKNRKLEDSSFKMTQGGEKLKYTSIITGKWKSERLLRSPFQEYRTYFNECMYNNNNLLIIGYGAGDIYINEVLNRFKDIHKTNRKVIMIDYISEEKWKQNYKFDSQKLYSQDMFNLWCKLFEPNDVDHFTKQPYQNHIENGNYALYLTGLKNTIKNHRDKIINKFNRGNNETK